MSADGTTVLGSIADGIRDGAERVLREPPTMEHVLLVLFLAAGTYMYLGADEFASAAAVFPRVMAGATVVLSVALLFRNYFPGPIRRFIAEPVQLGSQEELTGDIPSEEDQEGSSGTYSYDIDDYRGPAVVGILCTGYMILTFTVGMLYATPVFVAAYAAWARMESDRAVTLVVLSFAIAYIFFEFISSDIAEGWLTGWEFPVPFLLVAIPSVAVSTYWLVYLARSYRGDR